MKKECVDKNNSKAYLKVRVKRALSEVLPLCMLSILISALVCSMANDMYAFVKKDNEVCLSFDSPCTLQEFSKTLGEYNVVENPAIFDLYVRSKEKTKMVEAFSGELCLNSNMSYREILSSLS